MRRRLRKGSVDFSEYRELLTELIEHWPSIRPYIRCTVNPETGGKAISVSIISSYCVGFVSSSGYPYVFFSDEGDIVAFNCQKYERAAFWLAAVCPQYL